MSDAIGPYQILGELGRGAMAVVWRAFDTRLEREVALKEPMIAAGTDAATVNELSARFVREGQAAAKLNHPGIVTVYAADVFDGRAAIAMELIEGETLGSILERGALSYESAIAVLVQLLDAVGYAHSRGVVHRDIKPDNLFITPDGRLKLTDFGIAHVGASAALTQAGTIMGTPGYMSPEQITGDISDSRSDIFAIGVIAFELVTGTNPFGATDGVAPTTVMYRVVHEETPNPAHHVGIDSHAALVIQTAMAKDPAARFQTAESMKAALLGGELQLGGATTGAGMPATVINHANVAGKPQHDGGGKTLYVVLGVVAVLVLVGMLVFSGGSPGTTNAGSVQPVVAKVEETVPAAGAGSVISAEEAPAQAAAPAEPVVDYESEVSSVIESWRVAWESENLGQYMGFYAPDFYSNYKKMNRSQWQSYKSGLFAKYSYQTVTISPPVVTVSGDTATAVFDQKFESNSFKDYGSKTLRLKRSGSVWLITGEEFSLK